LCVWSVYILIFFIIDLEGFIRAFGVTYNFIIIYLACFSVKALL